MPAGAEAIPLTPCRFPPNCSCRHQRRIGRLQHQNKPPLQEQETRYSLAQRHFNKAHPTSATAPTHHASTDPFNSEKELFDSDLVFAPGPVSIHSSYSPRFSALATFVRWSMLSLRLALALYWLDTCYLRLCCLHNHLEMTRRKTWQKVKRLTRCIARSFSHRADRDYEDPDQLYTKFDSNTSKSSWPPTMADGEEDFSSLPLTDRWVHKVCFVCPGCQLVTLSLGLAHSIQKLIWRWPILGLESSQRSIRGSYEVIRGHRQRNGSNNQRFFL